MAEGDIWGIKMGWPRLRASVLGLLLLPAMAIGDAPPRVVTAVAGSGDGAAIDRFTLRFSEDMVVLTGLLLRFNPRNGI